MPGYGLPSTPYGMHPHQGMPAHVPSASYDTRAIAARDEALRRFVWMLVLAVAAIVGIVIATQL